MNAKHTFIVDPARGHHGELLFYDVDMHQDGCYFCGVATFWINGRTAEQARQDAEDLAAILRYKAAWEQPVEVS